VAWASEGGPAIARILITNDDGYESPGLHALVQRALADGHEVCVVAPLRDMTGWGTAVGEARPGMRLPIASTSHPAMPGAELLVLDCAPSMCTLVGCLGGIGAPPALVVAGINMGPNVSTIINHSGTLGAVFTAQHLGLRALAVSLDVGEGWDWGLSAEVASAAIRWMVSSPTGTAVSVNVPNVPAPRVAGVVHAPLVGGLGELGFSRTDDGVAVQMRYAPALVEGTDAALLHARFVTVTALAGPVAVDHGAEALVQHLGSELG
jgi:5'-nucleotidase